MNALAEIRSCFLPVLESHSESASSLLSMIRPANDSKFGDYQANVAMPLAKKAGKNPRDLATEIAEAISLEGLCTQVEIAGPGFINLTLDNDWLKSRLLKSLQGDRLGVTPVAKPKTCIVDFSSPNVAKPMHVGHIRSTVIGAAIAKVLAFVGHNVITDNHIGDWGTQFGMIIYGYKHFLDREAYQQEPIKELSRLYRKVRQVVDYHVAKGSVEGMRSEIGTLETKIAELKTQQSQTEDKKELKKVKKEISATDKRLKARKETLEGSENKIQAIESGGLQAEADAHAEIGKAVLLETAALHQGDEQNLALWNEFLPHCWEDMRKIYRRLNVEFDHELGESFYHDQLQAVVDEFEARGFARTSDGALCIFMDDFDTPMIIRKQDGAFLYSTTDLATIKYRDEKFGADACLYVVDHRQHQHFEKLFAAAKLWGYNETEYTHVSFGTVLGENGKPYKTREGDAVGLVRLLDNAEAKALQIAIDQNPDLTDEEHKEIARVIGIGGLKYVDLSQNRTSDYEFSYEKMLALKGNTATYLQFSYARVQGIIRKTGADPVKIRENPVPFEFATDIERELAVKLIRYSEALDDVLVEYKPNFLCNYLFELTQIFFRFLEQCSVKDAETESLKQSRLQFCDLMARTVESGLDLLGIEVVEQM